MTVDEGESFGITMMYDMDPSMMGMDGGMLEVDEDSEAVITMEMTEAWSPDGYHTSSVMGIADGDLLHEICNIDDSHWNYNVRRNWL